MVGFLLKGTQSLCRNHVFTTQILNLAHIIMNTKKHFFNPFFNEYISNKIFSVCGLMKVIRIEHTNISVTNIYDSGLFSTESGTLHKC